ncbi:type I polyketide synthase [Bradyrhizobium sp.]|uniref:type I polyketide synthase n=1 Tax=Bradyrhizobium sp. TaxID=376 RepID=UPI001ED7927B|nr:type I polyketide synthase [Bradyrhizobium sp.]MBV9985723.1 type I polyketide synthase [Bradyrhizobium sp.]
MPEAVPANGSDRSLETALLLEKYEPIAIVGIGMRVPGDNNSPAEFAEFLKRGRSGIAPIPRDRWDVDAIYSSESGAKGKNRQSSGGYLSNIDRFDAKFFGISPKEANVVDPQHRLLLECAWIALESANIDPTSLRNNDGGVYIGMSSYDWSLALEAVELSRLETDVATGASPSAACGRLSHFLGWRGPSVTFDTACSSSLTALHFAVQGLRRRECDIALCGGVNVICHPRNHVVFSLSSMLAPDGRCKAFDDSADGYGRSEGCIIFVLKRLSDARRDGDSILALVRGSSVRQDGESGGLTVPNGDAQVTLMTQALASALLRPEDIQYVEAHGTGTPLGDPIEMGSIHNVFSATHNTSSPIIVGSVKTNIGHLEPAAGAAGLLKVILQMQEGKIFPHINLARLSRYIPWDQYCVSVPTQLRDWPAGRRRALVNSFGFAGTIASVVVEEARPPATAVSVAADAGKPIFTVSAKSPASLKMQLNQYQDRLRRCPKITIAELCYTTNVSRAHFGRRFASVVSSGSELLAAIQKKLSRIDVESKREVQNGQIAFLFTGSGSQYVGMGRALYAQFATVRRFVDQCDKLFQPLVGCSIKALCFDASIDHEKKIHQTQYTQPALFTLEYAIAQLWMSWGITPTVVLGHSIGEIAAAAVAGLFSLEDAVKLVAARGQLMQSAAPGGMVAVRAAHQDIAPLLRSYADAGIAAINTPEQCVVAGGMASLGLICQALQGRGIETTELPISVASHSPLMDAVVPALREVLNQVAFSDLRISMVSNMTGRIASAAEVGNPEYWVNHLVKPVNFAAGLQNVQARGSHIFLEVGPSSTLLDIGRMFAADTTHVWLPSLSSNELDNTDTIRRSLAHVYANGAAVSWSAYHSERPCRKVAIPTYAFDRRSYGLGLPSAPAQKSHSASVATAASRSHPLLDAEPSTAERCLEQQKVNVDPDALRKLPTRDRKALITTTLRMIVAQVLRFDSPDDVEIDMKFADMGLYSLASLEFRNVLQTAFHIPVAATTMIDYPKVSVLADFIDRELAGDSSEASARPIGRQLAEMSDAEADAELAALGELT